MQRNTTILTLGLGLALAACAAPAAPPQVMPDKPNDTAMMEQPATAPAAAMMDTPAEMATPMADESMSHSGDTMMDQPTAMPVETMMDQSTAMPADTMMGTPAAELPAWFQVPLVDVNTGAAFMVADFQGKVVLVETLAVWCSKCLQQQKEVLALHGLLGERMDFVSLGLDIDLNETPDFLQAHTARHGFNWSYAVAPREVARDLAALYGDQFLNPPSTPMLIVDRQGGVHPLPFGIKSAADLQAALAPFLAAGS